MSSTSTITFTLDGDVKTFQILVKDAESLKKVLGTSATEAKKLSQRLLDMNQAAEAFRGMETLIRGIESAFGSWSAEFNEANANETRLAQSMKNAMGATREQTDAIVELTDAQEELGIIDGQFHCFRYVKVRNLKVIHNSGDALLAAVRRPSERPWKGGLSVRVPDNTGSA